MCEWGNVLTFLSALVQQLLTGTPVLSFSLRVIVGDSQEVGRHRMRAAAAVALVTTGVGAGGGRGGLGVDAPGAAAVLAQRRGGTAPIWDVLGLDTQRRDNLKPR